MRVLTHPPLVIVGSRSGDDASLTSYLHGGLWLVVEAPEWGVRRQAHLHAVRPLAGGEWRQVDLSRHALMSGTSEPARPGSADIAAELVAWLATRPLRLYRLPSLATVSELGETSDGFRRRTLGVLGPELQKRVAALADPPLPRWPWRRRSEAARRDQTRQRMASEIGGWVAEVEEWCSPDPSSTIRRLEVGVLMADDRIELGPPTQRDLML